MKSIFERHDFSGSRAWVVADSGARAGGTISFSDPFLVLRADSWDGWFAEGGEVLIAVGLSDGMYSFRARLCHQSGRVLRFALPEGGNVTRRQARAFVRVPVELPARLYLTTRLDPVDARVLDLSGGGARVLCPVPLALGDLLEIELTLQGETLRLPAKIVRPSDRQMQAGIAFTGLSAAQVNRIVSFTFWRQAQMLRQQRQRADSDRRT